jgi:LPXTG-motif cell wall-anchored protein
VVASCTELSLNFTHYEGPASNNTVTVTVDGTPTVIQFAEELSRSFPWSDAADHTWTVAIDANHETGDATAYDSSTSGSEHACVPTTTHPSTPTTAPQTDIFTPPIPAPVTTETPTTAAPVTSDATTAAPEAPAAAAPETPAPATAVAVANEAPVVPAATTAVSASGASVAAAGTGGSTLPQTGTNTGLELIMATTMLLAGAWMITITRRRDHHS